MKYFLVGRTQSNETAFIHLPQGVIMYFLYADSSGRTEIKQGGHILHDSLYITVGVIVHEKDWKSIANNISEMKREVIPELDPREWELHASDIWNNRDFFADRHLGLNQAKKLDIFSRIANLARWSDITIVSVVMFKDKMKDRYHSPAVTEYSWMFVTERFEHFLTQKPKGTNNGLLFIDASQKNPQEEIRKAVRKAIKDGGLWKGIDHVIEQPIFVESHTYNLIQLADMIAYVILKHYKGDLKFKEFFEMLKSKMYRIDGNLDGFGLKEFP